MSQIDPTKKQVAIIGAGAAGLMAAEVLSVHSDQVQIRVFEQKPTAARKILMAGKTGLNISHNESLPVFLSRYQPQGWLDDCIKKFHAHDIVNWMTGLGIESFVGSTGRIFPVQMKASTLVRAWLKRLQAQGVDFFYRHACRKIDWQNKGIYLEYINNQGIAEGCEYQEFDAIILACGGGSYAKLGSDGRWQHWFMPSELNRLYPSNVGVTCSWSIFMQPQFGQPLKRVRIQVADEKPLLGDAIISHYGLEGSLIYRLNFDMRRHLSNDDNLILKLDLLPDKKLSDIQQFLLKNKKQSLNNSLRKLGLDAAKTALLRECSSRADWSDSNKMAEHIKSLGLTVVGFRPIDEAISTGGGVRLDALSKDFALVNHPGFFCAGEMLDWDAPTGGYLLTACFATGRAAAKGVLAYLDL